MKEPQRVGVVGGGLGGLAAAALLARAGLAVTLYEKNERVGGKMNVLQAGGFKWDTGPSLITLPQILRDLWAALGRSFNLRLEPLSNACRYRWSDGTVLDENAAFWQRPEMARFLEHAHGIYRLSVDAFLKNRLEDWWRQISARNLAQLRHLPKVIDPRSLHQVAAHFFSDPHLVQFIDRFATYNGSSPFLTPAAFAIIPYVQAAFGSWYCQGGLYQIAEALGKIGAEEGVETRLQTEVQSIERSAQKYKLRLSDDEAREFDWVICNEDVITADLRLLPEDAQLGYATRPRDLSTSGFVMLLGVRGNRGSLQHHNIFFSDDYKTEFEQIFVKKRMPEQPTIYLSIDAKSEPGRAPAGHENWFVLVNVPAERQIGASAWQTRCEQYCETVLKRLAAFDLKLSPGDVVERHFLSPLDFAQRLNAFAGSLYGFASHGHFTVFQRPPMRRRSLPRVWFVGGTTHPGGGVPLALLSGQIAAREILRTNSKR